MEDFYRNKKILITGHTGFQGAWLAHILLGMGSEVVGVSLPPHTRPNLFSIFSLDKKIKNIFLDIRNQKALENVFSKERPDIVFHLAAQAIVLESYDDPLVFFSTNIMGTAHVLETVRKVDSVRAVIVVTTDKVYYNDNTGHSFTECDKLGGHEPYSASKAATDIVAQSYISSFFKAENCDKKFCAMIGIARSGNVIGGGDWGNHRLLPDLIRAVYEERSQLIIRHPEAVRPWQHVFEPLLGYIMLAKELYHQKNEFSGAWNFGPDEQSFVSVEEIVKRFLKFFGKGSYDIQRTSEKIEAGVLKIDNSKAKNELKWKPKFSLDECLSFTSLWYKIYYERHDHILDVSNEQINSFLEL